MKNSTPHQTSAIYHLREAISRYLLLCVNNLKSAIKEEINHQNLQHLSISSTVGRRSNINNYGDYRWIKVQSATSGKKYWLTLFYNDIDTKTSNPHTQLGRIQFWSDIKSSPYGKDLGPHNNILKDKGQTIILSFNKSKSGEPTKGMTFADEDPTKIAKDFIDFIKKSEKTSK